MIRICISAILLLLSQWAIAQNNIQGLITDAENNTPLEGATIYLEGTSKGTVTDENGAFQLMNLKQKSASLRVSFIGFSSQTIKVSLPQQGQLVVALEPIAITAEEFIVSGTRASETTPTTFQVIDKETIGKDNLGQDLPLLLNYTPSIVTHSDAGTGVGYTGLRIRGTDQTRINVTVNGIPLNDAESHGVFWVNMPDFASSVDNIQIQRGVGTSTNGAATFGASLNIQTDTKKEEAYAETDNSYGSFNTRKHTIKAGTGLINDRWAVDARLSQVTSDGYIDRAFSNLKSYFVSGGYYGEKHVVKVNIFAGAEKTYQAWYGVPENLLATNRTYNSYTYDNETDNYQQNHYQFIYAGTLSDNLKANFALHYTAGQGYYEQFREDDDLADYGINPIQIGDQQINSTDIIRRRWLDNDFYGAVFSLNYVSSDGRLDAILGGGANRYDGDHFGEIIWMDIAGNTNIRDKYYNNVAVKDDRNVYMKATYEVRERLYLFGDLQVRGIDYSFNGKNNDQRDVSGQQSYTFFNPKFGLSYESGNGKTLYASYAVANREPVRSDFTDSPISEIPRPEKLNNVEAGIRVKQSNFQYNANFYYMGYKDQLVLTGQLNDVGAYIRENVASSYRAGIELDAAVVLSPQWTLGGNVAFSRNKIDSYTEYSDVYDENWAFTGQESITYNNTDIAFSPDVVGSAIIDFKPIKNLELSLLNKYVGQQFLDNAQQEDRSLDAYWTTDFRFVYTWNPGFLKEVVFSGKVNNVFDKLYEPNGYTFGYFVPNSEGQGMQRVAENYYYPMAGTNFMAGISIRF
ncbi:TonB-dependent receptor [Cyclobacterium marinum]|uniref:TonB-dependent receptor n=1 Tax=Cyclobacterium marinum (strain ATCC 25205 / DSM 745 / LMG 13164 / NCIMB 1802) TaxID=880070 RepID=G0J3M3_CYCMS|nr:TonB-dependent receptor [Cyclobacterium marinum]AEL25229.1 TonB-dependent receptor [Cyclobacterium marinum DSM 745]